MNTEICFHHLTRKELTAKAAKGAAVIVPLAATEQHGDHLPVFTDSLITEYVVRQSVQQAATSVSVLMAPIVSIGCSQHHLAYGGTVSFTSTTYLQMLHDIGESLITCGFHKIIFVNGHGGNEKLMLQAAQDLAVRHPVWTAAASYWNIARSALQESGASEIGLVPGHAGSFETSLVQCMAPHLVRQQEIKAEHKMNSWVSSTATGVFLGKHKELTGKDGFTDAAAKATAEKGSVYLQAVTGEVSNWLIDVIHTMNNDTMLHNSTHRVTDTRDA